MISPHSIHWATPARALFYYIFIITCFAHLSILYFSYLNLFVMTSLMTLSVKSDFLALSHAVSVAWLLLFSSFLYIDYAFLGFFFFCISCNFGLKLEILGNNIVVIMDTHFLPHFLRLVFVLLCFTFFLVCLVTWLCYNSEIYFFTYKAFGVIL